MALFKKVDKVLAALGNIRAMERLHVDTVTEEKIENIGGDKIAESQDGIIYGGIDELNGYLFLETVILSRMNIKTFKGATLKFIGSSDFELKSDTQEIESEFSNVSNRFITRISFDITKNEIHLIKDKKYDKVIFGFKKKSFELLKSE
ncbi:hypothetical protein [Ulvibacter antarcticus]|uniref:Uncharacterized protein n=1 Tax=Ulvibacter antarcticus TaxID=442714 RepID=A0A3L9YBM8_9FLAO|nr:hypothetical protein [Ulvibacter antarcticus]RMA58076.1 hypothetical protein BXY75_2884 [Ulvibacter antarcticus]